MEQTNINRAQEAGSNSRTVQSTERRTATENQSSVLLTNRGLLSITGVEDIISFDETGIIMRTVLGIMTVDGAELHIVKLNVDNGDVIVEGRIDAVFYTDQNTSGGRKESGSFFRRGR